MPLSLLPDPLELAIQALLAQPSVTALVGDRIGDRIPDGPVWPLIAATTVDDAEGADPALGTARVQCNCWADLGPDGAADAQALARAVRAAARDLVGSWPAGRIFACAPGQIVPAPDPTTGRARSVIDLLIDFHA